MGIYQTAIERLQERKRKLAEETAEVDFLLEAALKYTTKRAYNPDQLADARKNRWKRKNAEDSED